jgi:[CysO sulfur-carrier protein]-S-L-cysteine hydrolase
MNITRSLIDEIVAHALEDPLNEVCGVVGMDGGSPARALRVHRATNVYASPMKFQIEPGELLKLWNACEQDGGELGAIYHSHVRSKPYPSQTDVNFAANWPGVEWIIVGLAAGEEPDVRSYLIDGGQIEEVPLVEPQG